MNAYFSGWGGGVWLTGSSLNGGLLLPTLCADGDLAVFDEIESF